jgi:hypothetical protein
MTFATFISIVMLTIASVATSINMCLLGKRIQRLEDRR